MKRFCLLVLGLIMVLVTLSACGSSIQNDWASVLVGENVPTPQKGKLKSGSNLDDYFSGSIDNVSEEYYKNYVNDCIDMGFTVDVDKSGGRYEAFNAEGYELSLSYISGNMYIIIQSPEELIEITWPTTGIGAKLPVPVSNLGKVTSDSSNCYRITVGNTTIENFNDYVKACEQKGFIVDYLKNEGYYEAKDSEGYRLNLSYIGCNRIDIMVQTPKEENETTTPPAVTTTTQAPVEEPSSGGLRPEFKEAMDSYEEYLNEYVAFMKKYNDNPNDLTLLADYAKHLAKYSEMTVAFEKWEGDMNDEETAYYIDVQSRVSKKLLEVAE